VSYFVANRSYFQSFAFKFSILIVNYHLFCGSLLRVIFESLSAFIRTYQVIASQSFGRRHVQYKHNTKSRMLYLLEFALGGQANVAEDRSCYSPSLPAKDAYPADKRSSRRPNRSEINSGEFVELVQRLRPPDSDAIWINLFCRIKKGPGTVSVSHMP
jgi:hypothetical protein